MSARPPARSFTLAELERLRIQIRSSSRELPLAEANAMAVRRAVGSACVKLACLMEDKLARRQDEEEEEVVVVEAESPR